MTFPHSRVAVLCALLELARWHSAAGAGLAVWVGGHLASALWNITWLHPMAIAVLLSAAGNAYNDAQDVAIDRINRPTRPIPRGALTSEQAIIFAGVCSVIAFALAIPLGIPTFAGTIAGIVLLYLYTPHLKAIPLLGNGVVGLLVGMCIGFGGLMGGNISAVLLPGAAVGLLFAGREVLKTVYDTVGDTTHWITTVATLWGQRAALLIATAIFIIALGVLTLWSATTGRGWLVPLLTFLLIASTLVPLWRYPHQHQVTAWALAWSKVLGLVLLALLLLV